MKKITSLVMGLLFAVGMYADAEPTQIHVERIQIQPWSGSRIFYMLYDDPNMRVFVFPLFLAEGQTDAELGKTYVYPGEMDQIYAYWMLSDYTTYALYTHATFLMTEPEPAEMRIDATATDTNGESFVLVYDTSEQGIENIELTEQSKIVMSDGVLYIVRDNKMYDLRGIRVR